MQIFEAYGLGEHVIETSFRGSVSRIGGMSLADLQAEAETFHSKGFPDKAMSKLQDYGFIQSRAKGALPAATVASLACVRLPPGPYSKPGPWKMPPPEPDEMQAMLQPVM